MVGPPLAAPPPPRPHAVDPRHALGRLAERLVGDHLERRGYRVIDRHYRYHGGEFDLVARDGDTLVFVEVRARRFAEHGAPFETVGRDKQRRVARAALRWLVALDQTRAFARFDVASVLLRDCEPPALEIIQNAFDAE